MRSRLAYWSPKIVRRAFCSILLTVSNVKSLSGDGVDRVDAPMTLEQFKGQQKRERGIARDGWSHENPNFARPP